MVVVARDRLNRDFITAAFMDLDIHMVLPSLQIFMELALLFILVWALHTLTGAPKASARDQRNLIFMALPSLHIFMELALLFILVSSPLHTLTGAPKASAKGQLNPIFMVLPSLPISLELALLFILV